MRGAFLCRQVRRKHDKSGSNLGCIGVCDRVDSVREKPVKTAGNAVIIKRFGQRISGPFGPPYYGFYT